MKLSLELERVLVVWITIGLVQNSVYRSYV